MIKVAVIGGGPAGLCAARYLCSEPGVFKVVVYEQTGEVGGAWVYTDEVGTDKYGQPVHSSMYSQFRTNLPKEVMRYPDLPVTEGGKFSYITHTEFLQYLKRYAATFDIHKCTKLLTRVVSVKPVISGSKTSWEVIVKSVDNPDATPQVNQFDAVMVCNGHFSVPKLPDIPGMESFSGKLLHSHDYRLPMDYQSKTMVLLGAGNSVRGLISDLYPHAEKIYLSHRHPPIDSVLPENVIEVPGIERVENEAIVFTDGQSVEADVLMLCTGYYYDFPFLKSECEVVVDRNRITPLYKHVVHTRFTSLSFIGMTWSACNCLGMSSQVRFAMAALEGTMTLPSKTEMDADTQKDYDYRRNELKMPHHYAHKLGQLQWDYNKELLKLARVDYDFPPGIEELYNKAAENMTNDIINYRKHNFSEQQQE